MSAAIKDPSDDTFWVDVGFLPVDVGYVPHEKAWHATLARLKLDDEPWPDTDGRCVYWPDAGEAHKDVVLIALSLRARNYSVSQVCGILAHECMHAWRHIREAIGEKEPSAEFEAYVIQAMVQGCVYAHMTKRRQPWKKL